MKLRKAPVNDVYISTVYEWVTTTVSPFSTLASTTDVNYDKLCASSSVTMLYHLWLRFNETWNVVKDTWADICLHNKVLLINLASAIN